MTLLPLRTISKNIELELWTKSAGRCQFWGCNRIVNKSPITQEKVIISEGIASNKKSNIIFYYQIQNTIYEGMITFNEDKTISKEA